MIDDELDRIQKEVVVASFKVLSQHLPEGLRKTTKNLRIVDL
jgi:hypothetical protein